MNIDERLDSLTKSTESLKVSIAELKESTEFLMKSTESLHEQMQQFLTDQKDYRWETEKRLRRQEANEIRQRRALLTAFQTYLEELDSSSEDQE